MRDSTRWKPSSAISRPAVQPSTVERNIRRAIRVRISTESTPNTAGMKPPAERTLSSRVEQIDAEPR